MKLTPEQLKDIDELIYNYPTKYEPGFIWEEQLDLIEKINETYGKMNMDKYHDVQRGITCQMWDGKMVVYHCDVYQSVVCGLENRDQTLEEWD